MRFLAAAPALSAFCIALAGCGGGGGSQAPVTPIAVSLPVATILVPQDGLPVTALLNITSTSETALVSVSNLPGGIAETYAASDTNPSGTLTFAATASAPAGSYSPSVLVSSAGQSASAAFTLIVAPVAKISNVVDTSLGVGGQLRQFMSTGFQISEWTGDPFGSGATATAREATLTSLGPQHIRLQPLSGAIPMKTHAGNASDWDFSILDLTVQPILASADHSPEFQIATAPAWMCSSSGAFDIANHLADFTAYAANLVRYFNKGGFDVAGRHFQSPSTHPITWWGIFNEYNLSGLTAAQYTQLYNAVVPAMLAVDPTIELSAIELSDFGLGSGGAGDPVQHLPVFLAPASAGGVNTQVDVLSTHFYGSCNQRDPDQALFLSVPEFVANIDYFRQQLLTRPDLGSVRVWVTENNVNADFRASNGDSTCNPGQPFVSDTRGTSAFFAAWRPYVFSQLGKAGNQAIFHWSYGTDRQYGEADATGNPYLSYWVDRALAQAYPSTPASPGPQILSIDATDTSSVETLATRAANGVVTVMVIDRALHAAADNNGNGDPRTVVVDTSSLGAFFSANLLTIDATSSTASGPVTAGIPPAPRIIVTLPGYGVAILTLTP